MTNWTCKQKDGRINWSVDTRDDWAARRKTWEHKQFEKQLKQAFELYDLDGSGMTTSPCNSEPYGDPAAFGVRTLVSI